MSGAVNKALALLTDKEREALRLILVGHDAKSTARTLDISVHTVNDRLRNARRKLSVSSSREAARILGAAEAGAPQNLAHAGIGMGAGDASDNNADLINTGANPSNRTILLIGGMLIMSITIAAAIIVSLGGAPSATQEPTASASEEPTEQAQTSESLARAEAFLATVDASDWEGSWDIAGPIFQSQATAEEWVAMVEPVRTPLGAVESRELVTVQQTSTLPGVPEGEYEVLQFRTKFAGAGRLSIETVFMIKGENGWEVNGYFIA